MKLPLDQLPPWVLEEIGPIIASGLRDEDAETALRAVLHLSEDWLVQHGTTSALLAKELVRRRRETLE